MCELFVVNHLLRSFSLRSSVCFFGSTPPQSSTSVTLFPSRSFIFWLSSALLFISRLPNLWAVRPAHSGHHTLIRSPSILLPKVMTFSWWPLLSLVTRTRDTYLSCVSAWSFLHFSSDTCCVVVHRGWQVLPTGCLALYVWLLLTSSFSWKGCMSCSSPLSTSAVHTAIVFDFCHVLFGLHLPAVLLGVRCLDPLVCSLIRQLFNYLPCWISVCLSFASCFHLDLLLRCAWGLSKCVPFIRVWVFVRRAMNFSPVGRCTAPKLSVSSVSGSTVFHELFSEQRLRTVWSAARFHTRWPHVSWRSIWRAINRCCTSSIICKYSTSSAAVLCLAHPLFVVVVCVFQSILSLSSRVWLWALFPIPLTLCSLPPTSLKGHYAKKQSVKSGWWSTTPKPVWFG